MKMPHWKGPFSFSSRFEDGTGTNPEALIAAAHAGCYSMAFSNMLAQAGHTPNRVHTAARVHIGKTDDGVGITRIDLVAEADVPGLDESSFQRIAEEARSGCPVSKLFRGTEITLEATLQS